MTDDRNWPYYYTNRDVHLTNRSFVSSSRLLQVAAESGTPHADTTYKCTWNGFPVFISRVTDMNKKFHPTGISICKYETAEDFCLVCY